MVDVIVIGAGVSGAAAAFEIASAGHSVAVIEQFVPAAMASGWTMAGVRQSGRHSAELPLARAAVAIWAELDDMLGAPTRYRRTGNLRLARDEAEAATIEALVRGHLADGLEIELVEGDDIRRVEPAIAPRVRVASLCRGDGDADGEATVLAYVAAGRRLGVDYRFGARVEAIETEAGRVTGVRADGAFIPAARVVVAAGVFAPALLAPLSISLPLRTPQVTVLRSARQEAALRHVIGVANGDTAGRQEYDGRFRATSGMLDWNGRLATRTRADGSRAPVAFPPASSLRAAIDAFSDVVPAFANAEIEEFWCGLIDMTPDGLPVIDLAGQVEGLVVAAGFSGHGFCLGPITGRLVRDLALGRAPSLDLSAFTLSRFGRGDAAPAPLTLHG